MYILWHLPEDVDSVPVMANVESWPTAEDMSAEVFIAGSFEDNGGSEETLQDLEAGKGALGAGERRTVEAYIKAMRPIYAQMIVRDFSGNTAGLYNGSAIFIDRSVPEVDLSDGSVEQTIDRSNEVFWHETYHLEHDHTAPLIVMAETKGDIAAVIGGVEFTETALIEGLTVAKTGQQFVSEEYVHYAADVHTAIAAAGITFDGFAEAVNAHDVRGIDDRYEEQEESVVLPFPSATPRPRKRAA